MNRTTVSVATITSAHPFLAVIGTGKALEYSLNEELRGQRLSLARLTVLHRVTESLGPVGLKDLAAGLGCAKSNASVLVEKMQREGLVLREIDPADRRGVLVSITESGTGAHADGLAVMARLEQEVFAGVSEAECVTLLQLLARVAR